MLPTRGFAQLLLLSLVLACADEAPKDTCTSTTECGHSGLVCSVGGPTDPESCAKQTEGRCSARELCGDRCIFGPIDYWLIPDDRKPHYVHQSCGRDSGVPPDSGLHPDASIDAGASDASPRDGSALD